MSYYLKHQECYPFYKTKMQEIVSFNSKSEILMSFKLIVIQISLFSPQA